ncbi:unnamed protein product [Chrysoparadoxa australica]
MDMWRMRLRSLNLEARSTTKKAQDTVRIAAKQKGFTERRRSGRKTNVHIQKRSLRRYSEVFAKNSEIEERESSPPPPYSTLSAAPRETTSPSH